MQELEKNKKKKWFFGKDEDITEEERNEVVSYVESLF